MKELIEFQNMFSEDLKKLDSPLRSKNISPISHLSPHECMNIYHKAYFARLTEILGDTYSAVWRVMGDDTFFEVTKCYIQKTPSTYYDLSDYGESFPEHLYSIANTLKSPFIYDLARFELEFKKLFHKKQNKPLSKETLAMSLEEEDLIFVFGAAFRLFKSNYPIHEIWQNRKSQHFDLKTLDWKSKEYLVLYKNEGRIFIRDLSEVEFRFLEMLKAKRPVLETLKNIVTGSGLSKEKIKQDKTLTENHLRNDFYKMDYKTVQSLMQLVSELNCVEKIERV